MTRVPSALEIVGLVAILAGAALISLPLFSMVGGVVCVMAGLSLERSRSKGEQ